MAESKKKKKTCQKKLQGHECKRPLYDNEHCFFHSREIERKKGTFMTAFWKEYEAQKKKGKFIFTGFVFPPEADLNNVKLQGADLFMVDLRKANLQGADLSGANLERADLVGADLQTADLKGAKLSRAEIKRAFLHRADLEGAILRDTDLREAKLRGAVLRETDLQGADLRGADLRSASFEKAKIDRIKYDRSTFFRGIDVTQATGSPSFVRFAKDQDFLEELKATKPGVYNAWNMFADCGRTIKKWVLWSIGFAFYFGLIWLILGGEFFSFNADKHITWFSYFYYSIVTFTTLGFGDIVPTHWLSEFYVAIEVILGYVMLGGLISIFANKLARRS